MQGVKETVGVSFTFSPLPTGRGDAPTFEERRGGERDVPSAGREFYSRPNLNVAHIAAFCAGREFYSRPLL